MSDLPHDFGEWLKEALAAEFRTGVGHIDLVFGLLAFGLVLLYIGGSKVEEFANLCLYLIGKRGKKKESKDQLWAIISLMVLFAFSLVLTYFSEK